MHKKYVARIHIRWHNHLKAFLSGPQNITKLYQMHIAGLKNSFTILEIDDENNILKHNQAFTRISLINKSKYFNDKLQNRFSLGSLYSSQLPEGSRRSEEFEKFWSRDSWPFIVLSTKLTSFGIRTQFSPIFVVRVCFFFFCQIRLKIASLQNRTTFCGGINFTL